MEAKVKEFLDEIRDGEERVDSNEETFLSSIFQEENVPIEALKKFIRYVLWEESPKDARRIMKVVAQKFLDQPSKLQEQIGSWLIKESESRLVLVDDQVLVIREKLAALYESKERYQEAAKVLEGIDLYKGTSVIQMDDSFKLSKMLQIAGLYLQAGDSESVKKAEQFLVNGHSLYTKSKEEALTRQYRVCWAEYFDKDRRYLEAAKCYHVLSLHRKDGDRKDWLSASVACTILSPDRHKFMTTLEEDKRCLKLRFYALLKKVYWQKGFSEAEARDFSDSLKDHQKKSWAEIVKHLGNPELSQPQPEPVMVHVPGSEAQKEPQPESKHDLSDQALASLSKSVQNGEDKELLGSEAQLDLSEEQVLALPSSEDEEPAVPSSEDEEPAELTESWDE